MSKKASFEDKVNELQAQLDQGSKKIKAADSCYPTLMIAGIAAPFLLLIILFFLQPSFVQVKEGDKYVRSGRKVFYWSVALTLLIWLGMYLYTYCMGYDASMICAK
jgi:hypothetical protein